MPKEAEIEGLSVLLDLDSVDIGIVIGRGCRAGPAPDALDHSISECIRAAKERSGIEDRTSKVRDMLRHGKYKPTGRGKPASEYLHRAACEDRFPRINNLVDINNLVSLSLLLPISLVDLARAERDRFVIRRGRGGESYVFNAAGQTIDLEDLIVVARLPEDAPCANPIKDSMATKLNESSTDVMAVLYAPSVLRRELIQATDRFERALSEWGAARKTASALLAA